MKLINNLENLEAFVNQLSQGWYYIFIVARKKWCNELRKGEIPIHRVFVERDNIISKLQELEKLEYKEFDGSEIPEQAIGVYINPNKRDFEKGLKPLIHSYIQNVEKFESEQDKRFLDLLTTKFIYSDSLLLENPFKFLEGFNSVQSMNKQVHKFFKSEMKTVMSTSRGEKRFMDIDIDCLIKGKVDRELLKPIFDFIYSETGAILHIIQTKSGAHVQIETLTIQKHLQKSWHLALNKAKNQFESFEIDFQGGNDKLCPTPGTIQGGFVPEYSLYLK